MWNFAGDLLEFFPKLELPKQLTEATRKGSDMVVSQFLRLKANTFVEGHYVAYHSHFPSGFCSSSAGKESLCNAVQSLGWEDPLEKGKATHSNILAWRIPWTV